MDLTLLNAAVIEGVNTEAELSKLIRLEKKPEFTGKIDQTVDIYLNLLKDVAAKVYTKENKEAQDDYSFDRFTMDSVAVTLADQIYAAVEFDTTDTLIIDNSNIEKYAGVIEFLVDRIVEELESSVATTIQSVSNSAVTIDRGDNSYEAQGKAVIENFQAVNLELTKRKVEKTNRVAVSGDSVTQRLLAARNLLEVDKSDFDGTLREAIVGKVAGFTTVQSSRIGENVTVFFGRNAFGLVSRAPGNLASVAYSAEVSDPDSVINLRVIVTSLGARVADGIIAQTFFKAAVLDANRAKKVTYSFAAPTAPTAA